jgi:gluconolactonase
MSFTAFNTLSGLASGLLLGAVVLAAEPMAVNQPVPTARIVRNSPALDAVIAPDAKLEKIATGFVFTEGPMWHKGALWFSDLRGNRMYSLSADG